MFTTQRYHWRVARLFVFGTIPVRWSGSVYRTSLSERSLSRIVLGTASLASADPGHGAAERTRIATRPRFAVFGGDSRRGRSHGRVRSERIRPGDNPQALYLGLQYAKGVEEEGVPAMAANCEIVEDGGVISHFALTADQELVVGILDG